MEEKAAVQVLCVLWPSRWLDPASGLHVAETNMNAVKFYSDNYGPAKFLLLHVPPPPPQCCLGKKGKDRPMRVRLLLMCLCPAPPYI